jgi:hypothetical protein
MPKHAPRLRICTKRRARPGSCMGRSSRCRQQGMIRAEQVSEWQRDSSTHEQALELAGCYVLETDVPAEKLDTQSAHDRYKDLAQVEQDIRLLKTGLLEVRPVFVRKAPRTRGHVVVCLLALKLAREVQRRLTATFGTTKDDPHGVTVHDALDTLHRLCLLTYPVDDTHSVTRLPRPDAYQT